MATVKEVQTTVLAVSTINYKIKIGGKGGHLTFFFFF